MENDDLKYKIKELTQELSTLASNPTDSEEYNNMRIRMQAACRQARELTVLNRRISELPVAKNREQKNIQSQNFHVCVNTKRSEGRMKAATIEWA